jgi:hypothetical protein
MGASEIAHHVFLRVPPFLVSNNYTALLAEHRKTARHGFVIGEATIPMQFNPICKTSVDVIEGERPLHMPRDLDPLPGGQVTVYLAASFLQLFLQRLNRGIKIDISARRNESSSPASAVAVQRSVFQNRAVESP